MAEKSKITFVTAFIEIPSNRQRRSPDIYTDIFFEFTASLPYPLVVYVEEVNRNTVEERLRDYFPNNLGQFSDYRQIKTKEFAQLETAKYLEQFKSATPNANTGRTCSPECSVVLLAKSFLVRESIFENHFNTDYYGWLDFGVGHALDFHYTDVDALVATLGKKMRFSVLNFYSPECLDEREKFYTRNLYILAGAHFSGPKEMILKFATQVENEIEEMVKVNCVALEEQVWGAILIANPHAFDYIFCDYDLCLGNIEVIKGNTRRIAKLIAQCKNLGYYSIGNSIIKHVLAGLEQGYEPARELIPGILHDGYICSFYIPDQRKFTEYLADTLCLLYKHSALVREQLPDKENINRNLKFVGRDLDNPRLQLSDIINTPEAKRWRRIL